MENIRQPYLEKNIKDLNEGDTYVAISGVIIGKTENGFLVDDGSNTILVMSSEDDVPENIYIRVFGRAIPRENEFVLQADFIQDISKIDRFLYEKVKSLL